MLGLKRMLNQTKSNHLIDLPQLKLNARKVAIEFNNHLSCLFLSAIISVLFQTDSTYFTV